MDPRLMRATLTAKKQDKKEKEKQQE